MSEKGPYRYWFNVKRDVVHLVGCSTTPPFVWSVREWEGREPKDVLSSVQMMNKVRAHRCVTTEAEKGSS